ncbi:hypothetical protein ABEY41_19110 [Peribacillus butanolivorans]
MGLKNIYKKSLAMALVRAGHDMTFIILCPIETTKNTKCLFSSIPMN